MSQRIIVTTANEIQGRRVTEYLGVVRGIVVRAPSIGQNFSAGFAMLGGGNIQAFEDVCEQARSEAYARMVEHARERDADAIIAMRYDATDFGDRVTEVLAYGTAVRLEPLTGIQSSHVAEALPAEPE